MVTAVGSLRFLQPVTRELVHRSSVAEVFLTDGVRVGDQGFVVAAQWPRDHALYHPDENGLSDPLLFAETLRQGMVYVAHQHRGVPLGTRFVFRSLDFEVTDQVPLRVRGVPLPVLLEGEWAWDGDGPRGRTGARTDVRLVVGGRVCGRGSASMLMVDDRRYGMLRELTGAEGPEPEVTGTLLVPPHRVGRLRWRDCVLERGCGVDGAWWLRVDRDHAVLFDHPTDHIPLMVMLEGFRQLGHLTVHEADAGGPAFALARATVGCFAFGEFHRPTRLVVEQYAPGGTEREMSGLTVAAVQGDTVLARAETSWVRVGSRAPGESGASW
ncbi:ScbA/BarX family gamma-butyrolactone biosynthesis protein [Streptomyces sp. MUM 203J]|uniref:ScbA/BarX family gamma-butyrolactone biosynthesis protein n=1 Tax=Streptomyces sp. MUM 203J TaxID=2791990 RepID=UPI001F047839|nr:ScbA/BarX family gamma-butyrolactone biosynthesis protein [Streptomyces sp. MUM 203J]